MYSPGLSPKLAIRLLICVTAALFLSAVPFQRQADAHAYSAAYGTITLAKSQTEMTYALDELSVIELIGGDENKDYMLEQEEFDAIKDQIEEMVREHVVLHINGTPIDWSQVESFILNRKGDATQVILKVLYPPVAASDTVSLTDDLYQHDIKTNYVNLLTIQYGDQKSTAALSGSNRTWQMLVAPDDYARFHQDLQQTANAAETGSSSGGKSEWFSFFKLGMNHILNGYDHLLFLFSLLIARQKFKQYAAMITAFTLAHSLTLTLTVLGVLQVPSMIVEPAIALSICYVAADNMFRKQVDKRWIVTFLFGLIHGMGFADILKEMDIPRSQLGADLLSFNLGIEAVQLTIVAILLPLLYGLHKWKYQRQAVLAGSSIALVLGGVWLIQRLMA